MNIFFLHTVAAVAAEWHCDKHVVKMILESTQLLWTAQHVLHGGPPPDIDTAPTTKAGIHGYKPTHKNHPCNRWVRESPANYRWLCDLADALVAEYHHRYPARRGAHACEAHLAWLRAHPPPFPPTAPRSLTWPALAMPDEYKISKNPTVCYRAYYLGAKSHFLNYTGRAPPVWLSLPDEVK